MKAYQRITISTGENVGEPILEGGLPIYVQGLADVTLADLTAAFSTDTLAQIGLLDTGFLPVVMPDPPPPPPPRREIPKSTVVARLQSVGKFDAVWTILQANPLAFSQWFAPDWPNVYFDDATMLAMLNGAGLSSDEIALVTA